MRLRRAAPLALCSLALCLLLASDASSAAGLPPGGLPWALPLAWALTAAGVLSRLAAGLVAIGWVPKRVCSLLVDDLDPRRCLDAVEGCLPLLGLERKRLGPDGVSLAFSAGVSLALLGEDGGARGVAVVALGAGRRAEAGALAGGGPRERGGHRLAGGRRFS